MDHPYNAGWVRVGALGGPQACSLLARESAAVLDGQLENGFERLLPDEQFCGDERDQAYGVRGTDSDRDGCPSPPDHVANGKCDDGDDACDRYSRRDWTGESVGGAHAEEEQEEEECERADAVGHHLDAVQDVEHSRASST